MSGRNSDKLQRCVWHLLPGKITLADAAAGPKSHASTDTLADATTDPKPNANTDNLADASTDPGADAAAVHAI